MKLSVKVVEEDFLQYYMYNADTDSAIRKKRFRGWFRLLILIVFAVIVSIFYNKYSQAIMLSIFSVILFPFYNTIDKIYYKSYYKKFRLGI